MGSSKAHFAAIDGLRAVAVLGVIAYHALQRFASAHPGSAGPIAIGARGVDLFFVISGFCLAYPVLAARRNGRGRALDAREYARFLGRRLSRIVPPFYTAVALFGALALTAFGAPTAATPHPSVLAVVRDAFADLTFAPATDPVLDGSFWTLGFEMNWYLVCPLAIALFVRSRVAFLALGVALYALYASPFARAEEGCMPTFMLGIFAAELALSRARTGLAIAALAPAALAIASLTQMRTGGGADHGSALWALTAFAVVVAGTTTAAGRLLAWRPLAGIGLASYGIYLVHQPLLDWLLARGVPWYAAAAAGLGTGLAFWYAIERPLARPERRRAMEDAVGRFGCRLLGNSVLARRVFDLGRGIATVDAVDGAPAV